MWQLGGRRESVAKSKLARHVAALPRARFVSNGAGEIDFLSVRHLAHYMQRSRFSRLVLDRFLYWLREHRACTGYLS